HSSVPEHEEDCHTPSKARLGVWEFIFIKNFLLNEIVMTELKKLVEKKHLLSLQADNRTLHCAVA
ncbi:hypothetical protein, partial [Ornithinibacillus caprae]|uniref:hypothetical protein n=1 Tax=Ornithinibacillus caprae TaxID=2678566 RepID=UPI001C06E0F1